MLSLIVITTATLITLSVIHVYWAFGGRRGWESALPTKPDGQFLFRPGLLTTLIVAIGLLLFALIITGNYGLLDQWIGRKYIQFGTWTISFVFILRAIGDFKFVGFTKRKAPTNFADRDIKFYTPLCLAIALMSGLIASLS